MFKEQVLTKPVRCYLEEVGYNFILKPATILHPEEWFMYATEFNDDGYAIVENFERKKMRMDIHGNLEEIGTDVIC